MNRSNDPFTVLGLRRHASLEEVKRAYRRLAMRWHPDRNASAAAENEFKRIKEAYERILDPGYFASTASAGSDAPEPDSEAAEEGGAPGSDDVTETLTLTLEEAALGCVKSIDLTRSNRCKTCHGAGKVQHRNSVPCPQCSGCGRSRGDSRGARLCEACAGRGYLRETACVACAGSGWRKALRTLSVKVPVGILAGERLRLARQARQGADGERGETPSGDLYLEIRLATHSLFVLQQRDLRCEVPVSLFRLLCGGMVEVPTLRGTTMLEVLPYPAHGLEYRLPGQGFPKKHGRGAGDLLLTLLPVYPQHLTVRDKALLERLDTALTGDLPQRAPALAAWAERLREQQNQ